MYALAVNGSPRKGGNTETLIRKVFEPLEAAGIKTELIQIGGKGIRGCVACGKCVEMKNNSCIMKQDALNGIFQKLMEVDAIVLGSPTYMADVTGDMKCFLDRAGIVCYANGRPLKHKVGAAVVAVRRGGAVHAFHTMNQFFQFNQMFMVGSTYWNMVYGLQPGVNPIY